MEHFHIMNDGRVIAVNVRASVNGDINDIPEAIWLSHPGIGFGKLFGCISINSGGVRTELLELVRRLYREDGYYDDNGLKPELRDLLNKVCIEYLGYPTNRNNKR